MPTTRTALPRLCSLAALALGSLSLAACDAEQPEGFEGHGRVRMVELTETCVPLMAGQSIEAGTVCVSVDASVDTSAQCGAGATGALRVVYTTTGGWTLADTHLAVGDELADIPTNNKGNPKIGQFPYGSGDITGATTQAFAVPLCELGLDGADETCEPSVAHIAAHAVVGRDLGGGKVQTETAWGDGESLTEQGSWAEAFSVTLECGKCTVEGGDDKAPNPLADLDDEFDGELSGWEIDNPSAAAVSIAEGGLRIEPAAFTQWYDADQAVHVYKAVAGDFAVTTRMTVTSLDGGATVPGEPYRIGGLMLRSPAGGPNTVHVGIGNMGTGETTAVTKSTVDGTSTVGTLPWAGQTEAELRLCRVGADVQTLIRLPGQDWTIINELVRDDLPQTLAAGPIAYAGTANADLQARAEWVHFRSVSSLADCTHD